MAATSLGPSRWARRSTARGFLWDGRTASGDPLSPSRAEDVAAEAHYSALLQRCAAVASEPKLGGAIHGGLLKRCILPSSLFLQNHLLNAYFKCGDVSSSLRLFEEMPQRNVVSWSAAIGGLVQGGLPEKALSLFLEMRRGGARPNEFTLVSSLNACTSSGDLDLARQFYAQVIQLGFEANVFLMNAFLTALLRNRRLAEAVELFEKFHGKDVVSWNTMIAGYLQLSYSDVWGFWCRMNREAVPPNEFTFSSILTGLAETASLRHGLQVHAQLVKYGYGDDTCVGNSLADMYLKNQSLPDGLKAFDGMLHRDVVSWTQMASGCVQCGDPGSALRVLKGMMLAGVKPNRFTLATAFNACSSLVSLEEGRKTHALRIKLGEDAADLCVDNALIDMYAKCGCMEGAMAVFRSMRGRSVISWTTMIMGFAQNGLPREALEAFKEMVSERPRRAPRRRMEYFGSMARDHGVEPGEDHYACMVGLLGRAGRIAEAEALIESMPFRAGALAWQTLLAACRVHGDAETGQRAAERALSQDREDPSTYVLLSNTFAHLRDWNGVGRVRGLMENSEVEKVPGCSWIEVMVVAVMLTLDEARSPFSYELKPCLSSKCNMMPKRMWMEGLLQVSTKIYEFIKRTSRI
ncbi:unnamed protein product [Spirodela intermedia]|uniref:Uncharacterized protein n=1 Tax=Spirodela intermedia TaxID=51605 RepID=A0A7I8IED1_SPIIN|nr:unnamed protein product [Spirodela intermedia]CAA6655735.1 unnamed protein product [Spirodela intermedia]